MKLLLITDQPPGTKQSAIDGIFDAHLRQQATVDIAYFAEDNPPPSFADGRLIFPHAWKHIGLVAGVQRLTDWRAYDVVIVRNFFSVLRQILSARERKTFALGFWESFPHSYRRLYEARINHHAVLRKSIEYAFKQRTERALLSRCDFYLPITAVFQQEFRATLSIPSLPLPMGVDFEALPAGVTVSTPATSKRFVYAGAVDRVRQFDLIVEGFQQVRDDFRLDIYTSSKNELVDHLRTNSDKRIAVRPALPRQELLAKFSEYDAGVGLLPDNLLYRVSSPTKTLEYYAMGLPAILHHHPEYDALFNEQSAFFCALNRESITTIVQKILSMDMQKLREMGARGREVVLQQRHYSVLATRLHEFLSHLHRVGAK